MITYINNTTVWQMIQALNNPYDHIWSVNSDGASFTNGGRVTSKINNWKSCCPQHTALVVTRLENSPAPWLAGAQQQQQLLERRSSGHLAELASRWLIGLTQTHWRWVQAEQSVPESMFYRVGTPMAYVVCVWEVDVNVWAEPDCCWMSMVTTLLVTQLLFLDKGLCSYSNIQYWNVCFKCYNVLSPVMIPQW